MVARSGRQHVMPWCDGFDIWRQKKLYREANQPSEQKMCAGTQGGAIPTANSTLRGQGSGSGDGRNLEQGTINRDDADSTAGGQGLVTTDTPDGVVQLDPTTPLQDRFQ